MAYQPTNYILTSGIGSDEYELVSFDKALMNSAIGNYNLVKVSSILPGGCSKKTHLDIAKGSILFTAFASICSKNEGIISAAVAVGKPFNLDDIGVIMEYSCFSPKSVSERIAIEMVERSMALRRIRIKEIDVVSAEAEPHYGVFSSVCAAIAMW